MIKRYKHKETGEIAENTMLGFYEIKQKGPYKNDYKLIAERFVENGTDWQRINGKESILITKDGYEVFDPIKELYTVDDNC